MKTRPMSILLTDHQSLRATGLWLKQIPQRQGVSQVDAAFQVVPVNVSDEQRLREASLQIPCARQEDIPTAWPSAADNPRKEGKRSCVMTFPRFSTLHNFDPMS